MESLSATTSTPPRANTREPVPVLLKSAACNFEFIKELVPENRLYSLLWASVPAPEPLYLLLDELNV
jgi:hypothetical protein